MITNVKQEDFEKIFKQHIKIESFPKSIDGLFSPRYLSKINYKPYYQRNYVWDNNKASYFIESILLGTEIPPLIFFNNNTDVEVIDGRQRFETIQRFMKDQFSLSEAGLTVLKQLKKKTFSELAKKDSLIIESFLDAKIRIIEFALVNEPPLDKVLEDRVKKEIFSRYNSGITPLRKAEIDNALYDKDWISTQFKKILKEDEEFHKLVFASFFTSTASLEVNPRIEQTLSFIRRFLVLPLYPIKSYAFGGARLDTIKKLYNYYCDTVDEEISIVNNFVEKLRFLVQVRIKAESENKFINRFALETFLWGLLVIEKEGVRIAFTEELIERIVNHIDSNAQAYTEVNNFFAAQMIARFESTANFFEEINRISLKVYFNTNEKIRKQIKDKTAATDTISKIGELESLRLNKPEPVRMSIEDIKRIMQRRKFLLRPSYQRSEVINIPKASSIIESILLGIALPPIFIYKREDGINEVIDGQQRLLTILGYIGSEYIDENGSIVYSKNHRFNLRHPRILREIDGLKFDQLPEKQKEKIFDFQLYIVEIEQSRNPDFDPIDLFIRLNDKPYPIREHSFEMWNSWVDFEIISLAKNITNKIATWFYIKQITSKDRDRMENEELITILASLYYFDRFTKDENKKYLDVYQINQRINARISNKVYISQVLTAATEKQEEKTNFADCLKDVEVLLKKIRYILLDSDKTKEELSHFLKSELDLLFRGDSLSKYSRRTMQDFYFLWYILKDVNIEMVKFHRLAMKDEIKEIFTFIRRLPDELSEGSAGFNMFQNKVAAFQTRYQKDERRTRLNENEKLELIQKQQNTSGLTAAPVFLGDDIEIDHKVPLAIGGKDELDNLQVVHKDENRKKGPRLPG